MIDSGFHSDGKHVYFSDDAERILVANAPSEFAASCMAESLTIIRDLHMDALSDIDTIRISNAVLDLYHRVKP